MSYAISIYHPDVRTRAVSGVELDEIEHPRIPEAVRQSFITSITAYGYELETENKVSEAYVKGVGSCPIEITVFRNMISFNVPYWSDSEKAIFEALQDASEICHGHDLVIHNPQTGEWIES